VWIERGNVCEIDFVRVDSACVCASDSKREREREARESNRERESERESAEESIGESAREIFERQR